MYDLGPDGLACPSRPAMSYRGQTDRQGRFVIRSGFGGGPASLSFVVSGSEDSTVYVWHREKGTLLASLKGHSGERSRAGKFRPHPSPGLACCRMSARGVLLCGCCARCVLTGILWAHVGCASAGAVNAVSWNGRVPGLLASASDDHTVRLWCGRLALSNAAHPSVLFSSAGHEHRACSGRR